MVLTAATAAAMGFSTGPATLGLFTLLNGVAFALWHVSRLAYMTETVPVEYRGRALSLVGGVTRVGFFAGPIVGGAIAQFADWRPSSSPRPWSSAWPPCSSRPAFPSLAGATPEPRNALT